MNNNEDALSEVSTVCSEEEQYKDVYSRSLTLGEKYDCLVDIYTQVLTAIKKLSKQEMEENYKKNIILLKNWRKENI